VPEDDAEEDAENAPEERVTALDVLNVIRKYSSQAPRSDAIAPEDECDELEEDDSDADEESEDDAEEDAENELEELVTSASSKSTSRTDAACPTSSKSTSRSDTTACSASPRTSRGYRHKLFQQWHYIQTIAVELRPLPLALPHPRKHCRETLFAAKIRMTGRLPTAPIARRYPHLQRARPLNRQVLNDRNRMPTA
jgi:hypothetical protein